MGKQQTLGESKWENSLISTLVAPEVTKYIVAPFFLCAYRAKDVWCLQVSLHIWTNLLYRM